MQEKPGNCNAIRDTDQFFPGELLMDKKSVRIKFGILVQSLLKK